MRESKEIQHGISSFIALLTIQLICIQISKLKNFSQDGKNGGAKLPSLKITELKAENSILT